MNRIVLAYRMGVTRSRLKPELGFGFKSMSLGYEMRGIFDILGHMGRMKLQNSDIAHHGT